MSENEMITFLCHACHVNTTPCEGASAAKCERCGNYISHFITWKSPDEDAAANLLIERELARASGGWNGSYRARQAIIDAHASQTEGGVDE